MNSFSRLERALWELKHVQYNAAIVWWAGFTKYVIYRKRGAFDSAHAYTLIIDKQLTEGLTQCFWKICFGEVSMMLYTLVTNTPISVYH